MSAFMVGLHLALLFVLGTISSPIVGVLSDRYGRKTVLIPCLTAVGLLSLGIGQVDRGIALILIILAIGLFSSSMNQILQATILDQIGRGTEGATMGLVMAANSGLSALAPIFAALAIIETSEPPNCKATGCSLWSKFKSAAASPWHNAAAVSISVYRCTPGLSRRIKYRQCRSVQSIMGATAISERFCMAALLVTFNCYINR